MTEHYFTQNPASSFKSHKTRVLLAGTEQEVTTATGVFSSNGMDRGTAVLLREIPAPPANGNLLDIGCGWGAITLDAALQAPNLTVWGIDVNERALQLTATNAAALGLNNVKALSSHQVPTTLTFAEIRSNPPIRAGKEVLHNLMQTWLPRLEINGVAYLVIAKSLGAPSFEKWLATEFADTHEVTRFARDKGFHVIAVTRSN